MEPVEVGFSSRRVARSLAPYAVGAMIVGYVGVSWLLEEPIPPLWRIALAFCAISLAIYLSGWFAKSTCPLHIDAADVFIALTLGLPVLCSWVVGDLVAAFGILCIVSALLALAHVGLTLRLVLGGPALRLDEHGITHRSSTFGFGLIPWEDVFDVRSVSALSMEVHLDDAAPYTDRIKGSRRLHAILKSDVLHGIDALYLDWPLSEPSKDIEMQILDFLTRS